MELKTARLTILIDPGKKGAFETLCRTQDMTPSQVVRRLIREYMEQQAPEAPSRGNGSKAATARKATKATKAKATKATKATTRSR